MLLIFEIFKKKKIICDEENDIKETFIKYFTCGKNISCIFLNELINKDKQRIHRRKENDTFKIRTFVLSKLVIKKTKN
jgi:hypothetical protein